MDSRSVSEREETRVSCGADNRDKPVERSDRDIGKDPKTYTTKAFAEFITRDFLQISRLTVWFPSKHLAKMPWTYAD